MAELIGNELWIYTYLSGKAGMRSAHDLESSPSKPDPLELGPDLPSPQVVAVYGHFRIGGREDPCFRVWSVTSVPFLHQPTRTSGHGNLAFRSFGLRPVKFETIQPVHHFNMILMDMIPLQSEDFTGTHAGKQGQLHNQLFAHIQNTEYRLHLIAG